MYRKLIWNEWRKNLPDHLILLLFMTLSVTVAVSVCLMLAQLFTSISAMYETARPPHFLQMHKGEMDQEKIDSFNESWQGITHWQTVPMVDIYGDALTVTDGKEKMFTLSECRLDISLVRQNEAYDVLLDKNRNKLLVGEGKIGVPVILSDQYDIAIGDRIMLSCGGVEKTFTVEDYVYDGQMNSTLCSSTRFLLSDADFSELFGAVGEKEYLIETYFLDSSMAAEYQTAYEQREGLPKDGQAVTYSVIFLLSAMTDIMTGMVFFLAGMMLTGIAMICLRYTVLAELLEDKREIGTMKAIGIPGEKVESIYLGKIRLILTAGCTAGFLLGLIFVTFMTGHMTRTFGEWRMGWPYYGLGILVCLAVYAEILAFSKRLLKRISKAEIVNLLVTESGFGERKTGRSRIHRGKWLSVNLLSGLHEAKRGYGIVFAILFIIAFLVTVPERLVYTMKNEEFITYMGSPVCDLLLELEQGEGLKERKAAAEKLLISGRKRGEVEDFDILKQVRLQILSDDGKAAGIHIDAGSHAGGGLKYLTGEGPQTDTEIALSFLIAEELGKTTGNTVTLATEEGCRDFLVSGIYQDVTNGGRTAKTVCDFLGEAEKYTYYVRLKPGSDKSRLIENWRGQLLNGIRVENMEEFIDQTLGGVIRQMEQASRAVFLIGTGLAALITLLFMKLCIAGKKGELAVKRAIGIPFYAVCMQEVYPVLLSGGAGIAAGMLISGLFGGRVVSLLTAGMGVGLCRITFVPYPAARSFFIAAVLLLSVLAVTAGSLRRIKKINGMDYINE